MSPLVVGFDSDALVTVDGVQPSATTAVGFSTNGCVLVVNQTPLTTSGPITITNAMAAGSYVTCYTVNGVTWVPQTDPSTFLEVCLLVGRWLFGLFVCLFCRFLTGYNASGGTMQG